MEERERVAILPPHTQCQAVLRTMQSYGEGQWLYIYMVMSFQRFERQKEQRYKLFLTGSLGARAHKPNASTMGFWARVLKDEACSCAVRKE